jgi:hypothetical protein
MDFKDVVFAVALNAVILTGANVLYSSGLGKKLFIKIMANEVFFQEPFPAIRRNLF